MTERSNAIIGYSGFDLFEECYGYNENACHITDKKAAAREFIEELYFNRFDKTQSDNVRSIEQMVQDKKRKQAEQKARKQQEQDRQQTCPGDAERAAHIPF